MKKLDWKDWLMMGLSVYWLALVLFGMHRFSQAKQEARFWHEQYTNTYQAHR